MRKNRPLMLSDIRYILSHHEEDSYNVIAAHLGRHPQFIRDIAREKLGIRKREPIANKSKYHTRTH